MIRFLRLWIWAPIRDWILRLHMEPGLKKAAAGVDHMARRCARVVPYKQYVREDGYVFPCTPIHRTEHWNAAGRMRYWCPDCGTQLHAGPSACCSVNAVCGVCLINWGCLPDFIELPWEEERALRQQEREVREAIKKNEVRDETKSGSASSGAE